MPRRSARLLALVAALAAFTGAAAGNARASEPTFNSFCKSAAPDASLTFGAGATSVSAASGGTGYTSGRCRRFVVDITVPPNSSGPPTYSDTFLLGGGHGSTSAPYPWLPFSDEPTCVEYSMNLAVYRRSVISGDFTFIGGGRMIGQAGVLSYGWGAKWVCKLVGDESYVAYGDFAPPPFLASAVYRVIVGATLGDVAQPVSAWAWRMPW
jgi:hypothetical protein